MSGAWQQSESKRAIQGAEEAGGLVAPWTWEERVWEGCHTKVPRVSPSACSREQSCEGMLTFPLTLPEAHQAASSFARLCNFPWGLVRGRASHLPVPCSPSADPCCHPVASAGKFQERCSASLPAILILPGSSRLLLGHLRPQHWGIQVWVCWLWLPSCRDSAAVTKEVCWRKGIHRVLSIFGAGLVGVIWI